ncbi:dihydrolipoamide acetyltransferase family protein [Maritalea porphyrae]|uniref:Dihydrolipoamide acetyltransferase component of pyruvate dehydrogenase complex n=1 Tax=Maritalea porphyrae TaxID=880732 RepID=A0ABQ5UP12_9HYPH|nr:dihydrolipoamide acetyltransferase family protein [Maritalea porphyrae]GLQ17028.1 dihydrolipoamide acetyltransferase component of pyruvate dehydrogenase complex [Maritalea porphyrae]
MGTHVIKLPDVGEGVAEAELVEWNVEVGDVVAEDDIIGAVMTDKATVEIPSPVQGTISWLGAEIGDTVIVGADLIKLDVIGEGNSDEVSEEEVTPEIAAQPAEAASVAAPPTAASTPTAATLPAGQALAKSDGGKVLASPAVRKRGQFLNLDLSQFKGTGPNGIITHEDLDRHLLSMKGSGAAVAMTPYDKPQGAETTEVKVIGLRRKIAEQMSRAKSRIPHITYVEEIDVTELEGLRQNLNGSREEGQPKLSLLPFLMRAMVMAIEDQPGLNAHYDDENGIIHQHKSINIGIAAQTDNGLMVPVVRDVQKLGLWRSAAEVSRLAQAARDNTAKREELTGSTITITSLGKMGGIVTTPVINHPEVAIIGVNKMETKPVWDGEKFVPRQTMNLSSSFDHRVVDGWDAAVFVQRIKSLLEKPLLIFS